LDLSIIIPTLNASESLNNLLLKIKECTTDFTSEVIIIDSESSDDTISIAKKHGANILKTKQKAFNHGGTRNVAANKAKGDLLLFITQDALPVDTNAIRKIMVPFLDENVVIAYGRQLSYENTSIYGKFSRYFNYPNRSRVKCFDDIGKLGIKTAFCSNSFAIYRKKYFDNIGGFPNKVILGEDMYLAGKAILSGYKVAYVTDAKVFHSHSYNILNEFQRSFDTGVFHAQEKWIIESFKSPNSEGMRYIKEECKYLIQNKLALLIPYAIIRDVSKYIGYKCGYHYSLFPKCIAKMMSMYKSYWN
jgi:rhamnosyltransferase